MSKHEEYLKAKHETKRSRDTEWLRKERFKAIAAERRQSKAALSSPREQSVLADDPVPGAGDQEGLGQSKNARRKRKSAPRAKSAQKARPKDTDVS